MRQFLDTLLDQQVLLRCGATLLLASVALLVRRSALRMLRRRRCDSDWGRLKLHSRIRTVTMLLLVAALLVVWGAELRNLALSLIAFGVAVVLALKELLQCINGTLVRTTTHAFSVGDRIEIGAHRGDVLYSGVLGTKILEVGPGHRRTGRAVVVPNSLFLSQAVVNESFIQAYVFHIVRVPLGPDDDWQRAEQILLEIARDLSADYIESVRAHMEAITAQHGLYRPVVEPGVTIEIPSAGQIHLVIRLPAPGGDRDRIEQQLIRRFLMRQHEVAAAGQAAAVARSRRLG
jgi:small-conductance mechanosensitive channel